MTSYLTVQQEIDRQARVKLQEQLDEQGQTVQTQATQLEAQNTTISELQATLLAAQHQTRSIGSSLQLSVLRERHLLATISCLRGKALHLAQEAEHASKSLESLDIQLKKEHKQVQLLERWHKHQKRKANLYRKQVLRSDDSSSRAVAKARLANRTRRLKRCGVFTSRTRSNVALLRAYGVPAQQIPSVIKVAAQLLDVEVEDRLDMRSVGRFVTEMGVVADMQIAHEISQAPRKHEGNIII
jgi:hypothetical protein